MKFNIKLASNCNCTGCTACASICPTNSITMCEGSDGFMQPYITAATCISCHKCENRCPVISSIYIPTDFNTQAYAVINKDEDVRMRSSSGGMFHALAKWVIEQGGVVFGARFDEQWEVVHDYTENIEGIEPFMRSKYVQSRIGNTFMQAEQFLKAGRQVLFVGAPCQVWGLKSYLHKNYDNLILVDFICHGVSSPKVWKEYLKETFRNEKLLNFNFRDKSEGWTPNLCSITTVTSNNNTKQKLMENPFFRGFRNEIYLRKSCYNCSFRMYHRISDFTIADFWGVEQIEPSMFDNKGTSIVFIHTRNAQSIFSVLSKQLIIKEQSKEDAIFRNKGMDSEHPKYSYIRRLIFYLIFSRISFYMAMLTIDRIITLSSIYDKFVNKVKRKLFIR